MGCEPRDVAVDTDPAGPDVIQRADVQRCHGDPGTVASPGARNPLAVVRLERVMVPIALEVVHHLVAGRVTRSLVRHGESGSPELDLGVCRWSRS